MSVGTSWRGFGNFAHTNYHGSETSWFCYPDFCVYFKVFGNLKELGYPFVYSMWFYDPKDNREMVLLNDDIGAKRVKNISLRIKGQVKRIMRNGPMRKRMLLGLMLQ